MSNMVRTFFAQARRLFFVTDEYVEKLPKIDDPCPGCGCETLREEKGIVVTIHRCTNCRFEGATR